MVMRSSQSLQPDSGLPCRWRGNATRSQMVYRKSRLTHCLKRFAPGFPGWCRAGRRSRAPGHLVSLPRSRNMSTDNSRRARIAEGLPNHWVKKHQNVSQKFERLYSVANPPPPSTDFLGDLQITVEII